MKAMSAGRGTNCTSRLKWHATCILRCTRPVPIWLARRRILRADALRIEQGGAPGARTRPGRDAVEAGLSYAGSLIVKWTSLASRVARRAGKPLRKKLVTLVFDSPAPTPGGRIDPAQWRNGG